MGAATPFRYTTAATYDLSALSNWKYHEERTTRYLTGLGFLLTLVTAVVVEGLARGRGGGSSLFTLEGFLAVLFPVAIFGFGVWTLRRSATGLTIGGGELRLRYPGGGSSTVPLSSPHLRLRLYEWTRPPGNLVRAPYRHQVRTHGLRLTPITAEAFEAILDQARKLQLSVMARAVDHEWLGMAYTRYTLAPPHPFVPAAGTRSATAGSLAATGFRDRRP